MPYPIERIQISPDPYRVCALEPELHPLADRIGTQRKSLCSLSSGLTIVYAPSVVAKKNGHIGWLQYKMAPTWKVNSSFYGPLR